MAAPAGRHASAEAEADRLGIDAARWRSVLETAENLTRRDRLPALAIGLVARGELLGPYVFGRRRLGDDSPLRIDDRFVVASLTKPLVAMAVLRLLEQGRLTLGDRVSELMPAYSDAARRLTTIRHLLTHTSGLPDTLPNNFALRKAHAPLSKFVDGACGISLDFPPGRGVQYQSLGYALLGEIISTTAGMPCGEFLRQEFFEPLGMCDTTLGEPFENADAPSPDRIAEIRVPAEMSDGNDWNWNSAYWRGLGAPWGGMISTVQDLARFCTMMLQAGRTENGRVLSAAAVESATTNQLDACHDLPEADRRTRPWGFGWRLNWPAHPATFGDLVSPRTYGHWGATGTLFWIDPPREAAAILLSTQPLGRETSPLVGLSNQISSCFST